MLVGDGSARETLVELARASGGGNIHFLPLQPRIDLPLMLASASVMALIQRPEVVDSVAPSKLLTYMASGRPVLAATNSTSEAARIVLESGCGQAVAPGDREAVASAMLDMCNSVASRREWGESARAYAERHFAEERVLGQFDRVFATLLRGRKAVLQPPPAGTAESEN